MTQRRRRVRERRSTIGGRLAPLAVVALASVLGGVAVGCSGSDPAPDAAPATTTTAAPATAPPTTQDEAADEALAQAALLTVDEVPGGPWVAGDPRSSTPGTGLDCDAMAEESAYFEEHARGAPGAKAPEIDNEANDTSLQLDVNIVADDEVGDTVAGFFADERFAGCLEQRLLEESATSSSPSSAATITDATVAPVEVGPHGDSASAWTVSFTIEQGTQTVAVDGLIGFVQVGRGFANVSLISQHPVTVTDLDPILAAAADKLETALAE